LKQVVITGGTGFIGSWLVKELATNNIKVIMLVRDGGKVKPSVDNIRVIEYHSEEFYNLSSEVNEIDAFYHLAWEGVAPEKKNDRAIQIRNIDFAMEMLEYACNIKAKRFIATGTVAEYAFCEDVMDVNAKQTPNDLYGASKTAAHYMLETGARISGMPFNWIVVPSTFGEGRQDNNILTYTIRTLLNGEKPVFGNLTQMWDFLYVGEVVRAMRLIGEKGESGKTYGIGSGEYHTLREYVEQIRNIIDPCLPLGIGEKPELSAKAFSSCVSIKELTNDTGFVPQVTFSEGISKTIDYYRV